MFVYKYTYMVTLKSPLFEQKYDLQYFSRMVKD